MVSMTTTSAPFREADVLRDTAGKFSGKSQSAPELTLNDNFDLAAFMQEPPTSPEPFTNLQPVVYRDIDGTDIHATIVGFEDNGYVRIAERTPGTLADCDDEDRLVDPRYLTEDLDISQDTLRRQQRGVDASIELAKQLTKAGRKTAYGLESYTSSLHVRDQLKVDGRTDWADTHAGACRAADAALDDLSRRDLIIPAVASWTALSGESTSPKEFDKLREALGWESESVATGALQAKVLEQYEGISDISDADLDVLTRAVSEAASLGERMSDAVLAADEVNADADAIGPEAAAAIFPAHVEGISQRKKAAYRKAVGAVSEAFELLERFDLLDSKHQAWGRLSARSVNEEAILTRAAGQAAILRHYQPETGLTDAQLDAISTVWDGAVAAHSKAAA